MLKKIDANDIQTFEDEWKKTLAENNEKRNKKEAEQDKKNPELAKRRFKIDPNTSLKIEEGIMLFTKPDEIDSLGRIFIAEDILSRKRSAIKISVESKSIHISKDFIDKTIKCKPTPEFSHFYL